MTPQTNPVNPAAMFKLSYGLFILTAKEGDRDNGCIINTAAQTTANPLRLSITVNTANFTHGMVLRTGEFNVSILAQSVPIKIFEQFGFHSGKDTDKFAAAGYNERTENGIRYLPEYTNSVISGKVTEAIDCGTHTLFIADITQAIVLSDEASVTYQYYFDNIKPKPQPQQEKKKGFICKICGYVHEGDVLPDGFICPICKHSALDFEPL
jgi:flavin reductase (DIM6/NTAB) family NADH-FMN oxidoreductase RutF